jgi:hypothetical protein
MERESALRSVTGAIAPPPETLPVQPFRGRDASLLVVSPPNGQKWRRSEAASDESGDAVRT